MACTRMCTASWKPSDNENMSWKLTTFDLQLFAGEKTEEPTAKRQQEAREKGQVAKSIEINSVFVVLMSFLALKVLGGYMCEQILANMRDTFSQLAVIDINLDSTYILFLKFTSIFLKITLPVMLAILVTSLVINYLQVGFVFSTKALMPSLDKLNPINGFARLFSKRSLVELVKSIIKIVIVSFFVYRFIAQETMDIPKLITADIVDSFQFIAMLVLDLIYQISAVMIVLAALDYLYQGWEHKESLKMTKHEVKEEHKETEGNPEIKSKIKEKQRALAVMRMMQEVPKSTVVVTNPTHFAVALKYEKEYAAPVVTAKGQDLIAQRIKDIARENKVAIVENKPLARTLYAVAEIGELIPPELYQAVAEVLAYVYRLKQRTS